MKTFGKENGYNTYIQTYNVKYTVICSGKESALVRDSNTYTLYKSSESISLHPGIKSCAGKRAISLLYLLGEVGEWLKPPVC